MRYAFLSSFSSARFTPSRDRRAATARAAAAAAAAAARPATRAAAAPPATCAVRNNASAMVDRRIEGRRLSRPTATRRPGAQPIAPAVSARSSMAEVRRRGSKEGAAGARSPRTRARERRERARARGRAFERHDSAINRRRERAGSWSRLWADRCARWLSGASTSRPARGGRSAVRRRRAAAAAARAALKQTAYSCGELSEAGSSRSSCTAATRRPRSAATRSTPTRPRCPASTASRRAASRRCARARGAAPEGAARARGARRRSTPTTTTRSCAAAASVSECECLTPTCSRAARTCATAGRATRA